MIGVLQNLFATHGIPQKLYADNVPFASREFSEFAKSWNFDIVTSSPNYPQSNGQAEKAVNVAKNLLKKCQEGGQDIASALLQYRNTEIPSMGATPAQMLMSRRCRTKIPTKDALLSPRLCTEVKEKLEINNNKASSYYNARANRKVEFNVGEDVLYRKGNTWQNGRIVSRANAPRSFKVESDELSIKRRSSIHLRKAHSGNNRNTSVDYDYLESHLSENPPEPRQYMNVTGSRQESQQTTRYGRMIRKPERYGYPNE